MARELALWSFLFHLLLVMLVLRNGECNNMKLSDMVSNGDKVIRLPSMDVHKSDGEDGVHAHPSSLSHIHKPQAKSPFRVFFTVDDMMTVGYRVPIYLPPAGKPSSYPPWLTREQADQIPLKRYLLRDLLEFFSISPDSIQASAVEDVLLNCDSEPLEGEVKFCATSRESLLDFVHGFFGTDDVKLITSTHLTSSKTVVQNYTILRKPQRLRASEVISCHQMGYPYMVYFCHKQHGTKAYRVSIAGDNGDRIEAIAVCHFDTALWDPSHQSFKETGTQPGEADLCHFIPSDHMIWVPSWQA